MISLPVPCVVADGMKGAMIGNNRNALAGSGMRNVSRPTGR